MAKAKVAKIEGMEMQDGKRVSGDKNDRLKAIDVAVAAAIASPSFKDALKIAKVF